MDASAISDALYSFASRGITCAPTAKGLLEVRPTGLLTETDRAWVRANKEAIIAYLTAGEPWNFEAYLRLMHEADTAVAASGVSGSRPEVQAIVEVGAAAFDAMDLRRVRLACLALKATVKRLAAHAQHTGG